MVLKCTTAMKQTPIPYWWVKKGNILKSNLAEDKDSHYMFISVLFKMAKKNLLTTP